MAKTSPRDARARRKSQPVKAAAGSAVASRAGPGPQGDGPPPLLKATPEKTAGRRNKPAAPKAAAAAPKTQSLIASRESEAIGSPAAAG